MTAATGDGHRPALVEALAAVLYRLDWPDSADDWPDRVLAAEVDSYRAEARAILEWQTAQGYLLPDPVEVRTDWEVWCHAGDSDGIALTSQYAMTSAERADEWGRKQIGRYGITHYTLASRKVRSYPDGSTWTGPWLAAGGPVPAQYAAGS